MSKRFRRVKYAGLIVSVVVALGLIAFGVASCGSSSTAKKTTTSNNSVKLPPGVSSSDAKSSSASSPSSAAATLSQSTTPTQPQASTPSASADLVGGRFTVVTATRPTTNKSVISSSAREVPGDYLEVELTVFNTGSNSLLDLSQYSFRLTSPGIAADTYTDYYGNTGTYGAYVDTNEISGTLLNYSDLSPAVYKVKVGETVSKVFLFFDLNPLTNAPNAGVTKANTQLIVYKSAGTDYGTQVSIPLSGYSF